jgi:B-cell receptor-associated protein 31
MMQFLFTILVLEAVFIILLLLRIDIRELLPKQHKLPLLLGAIPLLLFLYSVYSIILLRCRSIDLLDQAIVSRKLLEASLAGILLFLNVVLDRLYPLIREESSLRNIIKIENTQVEKMKFQIDTQLKVFKNEIVRLKPKVTKLEHDHKTKTEKAMVAEITASALKKQAEELYIEYDRLFDYNQTLRSQLQSIDEVLSKGNEINPINISKCNEFDNKVVTSTRCDEVTFSGSNTAASPRQRRPIYQH